MMGNFIEKIKDFIYDSIDFILIFVIILTVAGVIGWRLDILFTKDMDRPPVDYIKDDNSSVENAVDTSTDSENEDVADNIIDNENTQHDNDTTETDTQNSEQDEMVTINIPNGTLPPIIANILLEKGLIDNKMDFLRKSQELELDTKLKSGEFEIRKNSSLEEVIRKLAN